MPTLIPSTVLLYSIRKRNKDHIDGLSKTMLQSPQPDGDRSYRFGKQFEIMTMRMSQQDPKIHLDLEVLKTRIKRPVYRNESLGLISSDNNVNNLIYVQHFPFFQ